MQKLVVKTPVGSYEYKNLENLKKEEVLQLLAYLTDRLGKTFIMMGGLLYVIRKNKWFDQYSSFMEFCDATAGLQYRKAMYLIQIYESLVTNQIPFDEASELGFTKLCLLAVHMNNDNYKTLISWAKPMTTQAIENELKSMAQKSSEFFDKIASNKVLEPTYKETVSIKINKPDVSALKQFLITTPISMVVAALNTLHSDKQFTVV